MLFFRVNESRFTKRIHVLHDSNTGGMKLVDRPLRRDADRTDKKRGLVLNNNIDKLRELAISVISLGETFSHLFGVCTVPAYVRLSCAAPNLGNQEIDSERSAFILKMALQFVD